MVSPVARHSATRGAGTFEREHLFGAAEAGGRSEQRDQLRGGGRGPVPSLPTTMPAARVGELDGGAERKLGGEGGGEGGDDGVARARDVEDLAGTGGMLFDGGLAGCGAMRAGRGAEDGDSLLRTSDGEEADLVFGEEGLTGGQEGVRLRGGDAGGERELGEVGADGGGPGVTGEVVGFGVDEDGNAVGASGADGGEAEFGGERAFGVVGEDDGVDLGGELGDALGETGDLFGGNGIGAFDIEAEELLAAPDDAGLGRGGGARRETMPRVSTRAASSSEASWVASASSPQRPARKAWQPRPARLRGDVSGAAGAIEALGMAEHGDRGFGRDAVDLALNVAVEHDIADDEDAEVGEAALKQGEDGVEVGEHG